MSRFLLLNFKDFGLNQDITQTIQSQKLACVCCLDSNVPLINLSTCEHEFYLQSFYKTVFEPTKKVVCFECHNFLKKIELFRQRILKSFQSLEAGDIAKALPRTDYDKLLLKYNLTPMKTVNIYLPPVKYIPDVFKPPTSYIQPQINKKIVKEEKESMEPALPVVKIKAEPIEAEPEEAEKEKNKIEIEIKPVVEPEVAKDRERVIRPVTITKEELVLERYKLAQAPEYQKLPYRCESCVVGFNYEENILDHMKRKHAPKVDSVTCDVCLAVLHPAGSLNEHMFRHLTRYECVECKKRYNNSSDALLHHRKVHGDLSFTCKQCHYVSDTAQKFRRHKLLHHQRFTCPDCGVVLATRPSLARHMSAIHAKRVYSCVHCLTTITDGAAFAAHMRAHGAAAARAACAACGVQFKAWHAYNAHYRFSSAHQNERKIPCEYCGMKFATATHLRMHVRFSDHPKQVFRCPDCPKEFEVEAELNQHSIVHKKQRLKSTDRICDYCARVYTSREHLIRHIKIHMDKRQKAKERAKLSKKK